MAPSNCFWKSRLSSRMRSMPASSALRRSRSLTSSSRRALSAARVVMLSSTAAGEDERPHPALVDRVDQVDRDERDQPEQDAGEGDEADDLVAPDERGLREHPEATGGDDVELGHEIGSGATLPQCPARSAHGLTA